MTQAQAIDELLQKARELLEKGNSQQAAWFLDKVLRLEFTNAPAWEMLHRHWGQEQAFETFQRDFAQKNYPAYAHLLEPLDLVPPAPPESVPVSVYAAESRALNRVEEIPCPTCAHSNRPEARFCAMCGASLFNADEPVPTPPQQVAAPMPPPPSPPVILQAREPAVTPPQQVLVPSPPAPPVPSAPPAGSACPNCGHTNPPGARLCAFCGYDFFYKRVVTTEVKEKPGFRFHFVDLGDLVVVISLLLPWSSKTGAFYIQYLLNVWGTIAENKYGMGAAIIAFILLSLGATILVRAHHRILATLAALGSMGCAIAVSLELHELGPALAVLGAFLVLLGVIFFENEFAGQWLGRHKKAIMVGIIGFFVLGIGVFFLIVVVEDLQNAAESNTRSTQQAKTVIIITQKVEQTGAVKTQTAVVVEKTALVQRQTSIAATQTKTAALQLRQSTNIPQTDADYKKYQLIYAKESGYLKIYSANADGTNQKLLVNKQHLIQDCPRLSPDHRLLVFLIDRKEIWLSNGDGSNPRKLFSGAGCPAWSPDSQSIAFPNYNDNRNLYRIDIDGSDLIKLTSTATPANGTCTMFSCLSWSPDGNSIVFASSHIYSISAKGGTARQLSPMGEANSPAWSPDGKWIAFSRSIDKGSDIYVMDKNGENLYQVTYDNLLNRFPSWSTDGKWIGYSGSWMNAQTFFVASSNGSGVLRRIPFDKDIKYPVFAP